MDARQRIELGRLARWTVLVTTLVMVAALLTAAGANLRAVREATEMLHRGQAESLMLAVRLSLEPSRDSGGPPPVEVMEKVLAQQSAAGLRYVALVSPESRVLVEAGEAMGSLDLEPRGGGGLPIVDLGSRVWVRARGEGERPPRPPGRRPGPPPRREDGPPPRREDGPPPRRGDGPPPRRGDGSPDRPPAPRPPVLLPPAGPPALRAPAPDLVIEFEPLVADRLTGQSERSLLLAGITAAVLFAVAGGVWFLLKQREEAERRAEHARRLQALGEMSAVLAHEIRNPLASLKGHAQLLAERLPGDGRDATKAQRIVREVARLETLCQSLLDFCRTGPIDPQPVDPAVLVREAVESVGVEPVAFDLAEAPASWPLDPLRMRQVLANLLENAQQASQESSQETSPSTPQIPPIDVRVAARNGQLEIRVRDRGKGFGPGEEERIFEPFYTQRARGTGLGLAVARRIVEMHGGTLTARNADGVGAVLSMKIPNLAAGR